MICLRTIKIFCKDDITKIQNYEVALADTSQTWHCHHRLETHKYKDRSRKEWIERDESIPSQELKALGLYYDRPAEELIFMTKSDHSSLHHRGMKVSEETKRKIGQGNKGKVRSEELKKQLSDRLKGRRFTEDHKQKISEANKGKPSHMKGKCLSDDHKRKISEAAKRRYMSEEQRKKTAEITRAYWARKKQQQD